MVNIEQILLLRQIEFLKSVSDEALADLMTMAQEKTFKSKETMVKPETCYAPLHVLLSGSVCISDTKGKEHVLEAPQILCLSQVFNPEPCSFTITAQSKTVALVIEKDALYRSFVVHPSLAFGFLEKLSKKELILG